MTSGARRSIAGQTLVFYGDGKGKTSAAFGVALRAVGRGWKVLMIQYTKMGEWPKGEPMGEINGAQRLAPDFEVISTGIGFVNILGDTFTFEQHRDAAQKGLELYRERAASDAYDLIILDEAIGAVSQGQWDLEQLLDLIRSKPRGLNLLITGHDDDHRFIDQVVAVADLATEMKKIKHPFDEGHQARKGLDYWAMVDAVQLPLFEDALRDYGETAEHLPERPTRFMTTSSEPIERLYTPKDFSDREYMDKLGFPGSWPYTRGVHATGHRGKLWTMRMFAGFGNAEETNERFKYLLANGNAGLSVAFDMPTLYGYDTDDPQAEGEFGTCGVAVSSLADMEVLFEGIPLDDVTTSMTINSPAPMIWAMYLVNAEKRGIPWARLSGTTQNDILKEYIAQKEYIFPPRPSTKLVVDTFAFGAEQVPRWNTISISGYHIREAGATALQELAFTLADGIQYVQSAVDAGLDVDRFAPRLSFFFDIHNDFLEEVAKLRAARRIWARVMKERFNAQNERSLWCRFHCQTAGVSLFVEQPENNIVRTTIQALAAVLGGTQSLHTNSMDEAMALPSEKAVRIALRTQQIIAHESGVANTVDPLGGSYVIEALTNRMEQGCLEYFARIDAMGGMLNAIEHGFPQREISDSAYRYQQEVDTRQRILVGVNDYWQGNEEPIQIPIHTITQESKERHLERLHRVRSERDQAAVATALERLENASRVGRENLMPYIVDAVRAYATLGEMCNLLRGVYGEYREPALV